LWIFEGYSWHSSWEQKGKVKPQTSRSLGRSRNGHRSFAYQAHLDSSMSGLREMRNPMTNPSQGIRWMDNYRIRIKSAAGSPTRSVTTCNYVAISCGIWSHVTRDILSRFYRVCYCRRSLDWWIDLLTACIHNSELHFTIHWHTQTCILSLLQSPLATSWQRLLPREIIHLPAIRSSWHSGPCRILVNWQINHLNPRLEAISHQPPSLLFTGLISTELTSEFSHSPTSYFMSLHSAELLTTLISN
jgi:hypothetical protein